MRKYPLFQSLFLNEQEKSYALHYLRTNGRLALVSGIILLLFVMDFLIPNPLVQLVLAVFGGRVVMEEANAVMKLLISTCILAYVLPLFQFRFLMKRSHSDLYLSLPIERKRLFYVHYLIGLCYMGVMVLMLGMAVFVMSAHDYGIVPTLGQSGLYFIGYGWIIVMLVVIFLVLGACLYTFFTACIIRCHNVLDGLLICGAYTLLPLLMYYSLLIFYNTMREHLLIASYGYEWSLLLSSSDAHINVLAALTSIPWQMNEWVKLFFLGEIDAQVEWTLLLLELLVWVGIAIFAYRNGVDYFVHLKSEESEQPTKSLFTYPLLIPFVSFWLLLAVGDGTLFHMMNLVLFVLYLLAHFFAQRKIALSWRMIAMFVVLLCISNGLYHLGYATNGFNLIHEMPQRERIQSVQVEVQLFELEEGTLAQDIKLYFSEPMQDAEALDAMYTYHQQWLAYADPKVSWDEQIGMIEVSYELDQGERMVRMYAFPLAHQEYLKQLFQEWLESGWLKDYGMESDTNTESKDTLLGVKEAGWLDLHESYLFVQDTMLRGKSNSYLSLPKEGFLCL